MVSILYEPVLSKIISLFKRLPDHSLQQVDSFLGTARHGFPDSFERFAESTLAEAREMVASRPEQVGIREIQRRLAVLLVSLVRQRAVVILGGIRAQNALFRQQHVQQDLDIKGPIPRIIENEYRIDFEAVVWIIRIDW